MFSIMSMFKRVFPLAMYMAEGDGGTGTEDWKTSLPEDVQQWDEVKNSETPENFWQQMTDHRAHLGASIRIPGADAGEEDWAAFNGKVLAKVPTLIPKPNPDDSEQMNNLYTAMGRPEEADGYSVPELDNQGFDLDLSEVEAFRSVAHEAGLSNAQFKQIVTAITTRRLESAKETQLTADERVAALKTEWGAAFDVNYETVQNFLRASDAPKSIQSLAASKNLSTDMAKWFLDQHKATAGEGSGGANDTSAQNVLTPGEAQAQMDEIRGNDKHPFYDRSHPGHKDALARMVKLQKLARPKG